MRFENRRGQNEKKMHFTVQNQYFLYSSFSADLLASHFKDDLQSLRRRSYNILNHSNWLHFGTGLGRTHYHHNDIFSQKATSAVISTLI
jgi:hypothetical protein